MVVGYRHFEDRDAYEFGAPEGVWRGVLEQKVWGRRGNLTLYWLEVGTGRRWQLSVWFNKEYKADEGGPNFRTEVEEGEVFELTTCVCVRGYGRLVRAVRLSAGNHIDEKPPETAARLNG